MGVERTAKSNTNTTIHGNSGSRSSSSPSTTHPLASTSSTVPRHRQERWRHRTHPQSPSAPTKQPPSSGSKTTLTDVATHNVAILRPSLLALPDQDRSSTSSDSPAGTRLSSTAACHPPYPPVNHTDPTVAITIRSNRPALLPLLSSTAQRTSRSTRRGHGTIAFSPTKTAHAPQKC